MKGLTLLVLVALVLVGPVIGWAQSPPSGQAPAGSSPAAPPPAQPGATVPDSTTPRTEAPATSGGTAPDTTAPRAQTPGDPAVPTDRPAAENRILGLSPLAATILGLVLLGLIIALVVGRGRRDRDVIVDSRVEPGVGPDRPLDTHESEVERERRRRAS